MEKVSILISSYRYGHFLKEAIDSAINQTVPCEVIVMNNGSDDCTAEVIDSYDNIKKMNLNSQMDWCELLNLMISEAKGEYIVLLGADDKIEPDFVEKCLKEGGDVIRTGLRMFGDNDVVMIPPEEPFDVIKNNFCYFTSMFKKSLWEEVGGFDEYIPTYEDWDFWIRCYIVGAEFKTVKEPLFWYRSHKGQAMQTTVIPLHDQTLEYIKRKYE